MRIIFNGFPEEFHEGKLSIRHLLDITREDDPGVIVEVNGRFIYRRDFADTIVEDGDRVEFIHPSFGG